MHLGLALSFAAILLMFYWAVLDGVYFNRVTNVNDIVYQTDKTRYKTGEEVQVSVVNHFCKYRDVPAHTFINLVDTIYYPYEEIIRSVPTGCPIQIPSSFTSFVKLPQNITGTYHLSGYHMYYINPIQNDNKIKVMFTSNDFEIIQ